MAKAGFKDIVAWQRGQSFVLDIYRLFANCKDYSFRDQIQRAALSVTNNIAEGHARRSDKAFKNFLFIAKGSLAEVESMLTIAHELGYIQKVDAERMIEKAEEIARMLSGLIKFLKSQGS